MSQKDTIRRNTLVFLALGPVMGGLCMFIQVHLGLEHPVPLSEFFSSGTILMVVVFIIGGYVVGALPALAAGVMFALLASRRTLGFMGSLLVGAGAGFLTSVVAEAVIIVVNAGEPAWNWTIPATGAVAGAICGGYCWRVAQWGSQQCRL